jgi:hypothetical protein
MNGLICGARPLSYTRALSQSSAGLEGLEKLRQLMLEISLLLVCSQIAAGRDLTGGKS